MSDFADRSVPVHASDYACIDLINSSFADHLGRGDRIDRLPDPAWASWFLDRYDLVPDKVEAPPLGDLQRLRRQIRRLLEDWAGGRPIDRGTARKLDDWTSLPAVRQRVAASEGSLDLRLEPVVRNWHWVLASVAVSAVDLMVEGDPRRLKVCGNPDCSWMYYDTTLNGSKQYCSTTPCGTLMRVRRYRAGAE